MGLKIRYRHLRLRRRTGGQTTKSGFATCARPSSRARRRSTIVDPVAKASAMPARAFEGRCPNEVGETSRSGCVNAASPTGVLRLKMVRKLSKPESKLGPLPRNTDWMRRQGILKGEVSLSLSCWPPVWLFWISLKTKKLAVLVQSIPN
jgi:hypothetical protein